MSGNALAGQDVAAPLSHRESEDAPSSPPTSPLPEMWAVKMVLHFCLSLAPLEIPINTISLALSESFPSPHRSLSLALMRNHIQPSLSLSHQQATLSSRPTHSSHHPSLRLSLSLSRRSRNLSFFLDLSHPKSPSTLSTFIVLKSTFKLSQSE